VTRVINIDIGYRPREWQRNMHKKRKRFSVIVVHRRAGKTVSAIAELIDKGLKCPLKLGRFGYVAPFREQAKKIAWEYIKDFTREIPGIKKNEAELYVEFPNGARVQIFGADNPDSIRGAYFDGAVLDEYADMHADVWEKVVRPMLADRKGWATFLGTPKGHDQFYDIYRLARKRMGEGKDWYATLLPYWETNALDPAEVEEMREEMGEMAFRQEMACDFSVEAADVLIPIPIVEAAMDRHLHEVDYRLSAKVLGVDVARFGDDRSVIQKRQGLYCHEPIKLKDYDNMQLANRVAHEINEWKPDAVFIDAGRGEGVIDRLRELGYSVVEVNFGGASAKERAANKATEMWMDIKAWLQNGGALPDDSDFLSELTARTYKFGSNGKVIIEPKEKMKERYRSPDIADALALTFAHPVQPRIDELEHHTPYTKKSKTEYSPW
jgi:hypothetical protein